MAEIYDCPDVVITAGGTRDPIDDVRYIGNFSGGRLGHALADSYARLGHRVLFLAPNDVPQRFGLPNEVEHRPFTSAASLETALHNIPAARLVLQAAAVSDYTPERSNGKRSSDQEELVIRLRRNPKILQGLRTHFGKQTQVVGFKLLSGVQESELIQAAARQIDTCNTDACIANDLKELKNVRRLHFVEPDGTYRTVEGNTLAAARQIAALLPIPEPHHV